MKLTPEQEHTILQLMNGHKFRLKSLKDDLTDHLFCEVEEGLGQGKSFEKALQEALEAIAPKGLQAIERKTLLMLNYNQIMMMKKAIYSIGFVGALALTIGTMLRLLSMPGGGILFIAGFIVLFLLFVPMLALDRYKTITDNKMKLIIGATASFVVGLSGVFKVLHLAGANLLLMAGVLVFAFGFLPFLFFGLYKKSIS